MEIFTFQNEIKVKIYRFLSVQLDFLPVLTLICRVENINVCF